MPASGVRVESVCADYFMAHPFHRGSPQERADRVRLLERLIEQASTIGVTDVVIPCVDAATLATEAEQARVREALTPILPTALEHHVRLAFELDLPPQGVRSFVQRFDSPVVRINYDAGNSAGLGYDPEDEWTAYGGWISSVHIKDRLLGGSTVPLGTGSTRFDRLFPAMRRAGYRGLFVIQGARGRDHLATAKEYLAFVRDWIANTYGGLPDRAGAAR